MYTVDRQLHHVVCSVVDSPQSTCCSCLHSAFYSTCLPSLHSAYSYMQIADITSLHTKMACLQFTCCTPRILDPAGLPGIHPSGAYVASHPCKNTKSFFCNFSGRIKYCRYSMLTILYIIVITLFNSIAYRGVISLIGFSFPSTSHIVLGFEINVVAWLVAE